MAKSEMINDNTKSISLKISKKKPISTNNIKKSDSNKPIRSISAEVKAKKAKNTSKNAIATKATIDVIENKTIPAAENIQKRIKKSLKLDHSNVKPQEAIDKNITKKITYVKDNSINQNSPFFYKPSIFEKFNIDVVDADETDTDNNVTIDVDINNNETENIGNSEIIEDLKDLVELDNKNNNNLKDTISLNLTDEDDSIDLTNIIELDTSAIDSPKSSSSIFTEIKNELDETASLENDDFMSKKLSKEELVKANSEIIEEMLESIKNETNENNNVINIINEPEQLKEAADNGPVGKFFDSSISPISSGVQEFHSISKPKTNTGSFLFKNFTFEEATLFNNNLNSTADDSNVELNGYKDSILNSNNIDNDNTKSILANTLNKDLIIEEKASSSTMTLPSIKTDELIDNIEDSEKQVEEIDFSKVITTDSSSISNIDIDEIDLDNITLEQNENEELFNDDTSDLFDEISIDEISLDDISIDDIELTENEIEDLEENSSNNENSIQDEITDKAKNKVTAENLDESVEENIFETFTKQEDEEIIDEELNNSIDEEIEEIISDSEENNELDDYDDVTSDELEELEDSLNDYDDNSFSIEKYFGITDEDDTLEDSKEIHDEITTDEIQSQENIVPISPTIDSTEEISNTEPTLPDVDQLGEFTNPDIVNLSTLIKNFTQTITTLNTRIADLESGKVAATDVTNNDLAEDNLEKSENEETTPSIESNIEESINETIDEELTVDDIDLEDIEITENDIENINDNDIASSLLSDSSLENLIDDDFINDEELEDSLLEDVLAEQINETDELEENNIENNIVDTDFFPTSDSNGEITDASSDFFKILDTLSKTITQLEETPDETNNFNSNKEIVIETVNQENLDLPQELQNNVPIEEGKEINILINKDDIFSIQILNETYEIVADFDGISVISENIHISTPKNNFYVKIGEKYIEIHNQKSQYLVTTNFEDIEFANAVNNVGFAKKNNKIELNIKEAFKLSSINNKIELSMLNSPIADLSTIAKPQVEEASEEKSVCDNKTLLISEETQKVYLPYTIDEVMKKLNDSTEYQTVEEVIAKEYTLPLSTFKVPVVSRFKEAYKFMREKEKSSRYAAMDLGLELMFNSNLNPAIIRAAKDLKELNIYLDCLYENEVDKFNCFKIIYKVLPKIQ